MYTITFYSFKGGVGRTMALVNVAAQLAKMGRKVLVVDFDSEAPGLETFERLRPKEPHLGLVECVTEYRRSRRSPDVRDYIYSAGTIGEKGGELWVMPAGRRDRDYHLALSRLDWRKLYDDCEGFLFFEDLKAQWEQEYQPDYVLIDSRTGHCDVKGICTRQLPDAVVILFIPNEQNLVGLKSVCAEIRHEREHGLEKDIRLHFVMSNVPDSDDEGRNLHRHLREFRKALSGRYAPVHIIHRNETLRMLDQPVFVLQRPRSRLAAEYRRLVRALQIENLEDRDGALLFLKEIQKPSSKLLDLRDYDFRWALTSLRRNSQDEDARLHGPQRHVPDVVGVRVDRITAQFWNDADIVFRVGKYYSASGKAGMALQRFNRALALQPNFADALFERAFCHRRLRNDAAAAEDLLHYLRDHGTQEPDWDQLDESSRLRLAWEMMGSFDMYKYGSLMKLRDEALNVIDPNLLATKETDRSSETANYQKIWTGRKRNETALLELLAISLDEFLKTLELPPVMTLRGTSHDPVWLLETVTERLIQQRLWKKAIRWLEHATHQRILEENQDHASFHDFYLAMALWGRSGEPNQEISSKALLAFPPIPDRESSSPHPGNFQTFQAHSLLAWGAGDTKRAETTLELALAQLEDVLTGEAGWYMHGFSFWSFQEATARECQLDCEEMRRMIRGEPIRPPFLGSALASHTSTEVDTSLV